MSVSDWNVVIPTAPSSIKSRSSLILPVAIILSGSVTLIIWTLLSSNAATTTYMLLFDWNVAIPDAPLSLESPSSEMLPVAIMFVGSVTLRICTP